MGASEMCQSVSPEPQIESPAGENDPLVMPLEQPFGPVVEPFVVHQASHSRKPEITPYSRNPASKKYLSLLIVATQVYRSSQYRSEERILIVG
ncbi:hypothetical protein Lepto7375DRAFT_8447 [Leptolyngbya sp. PCC 7375]|nr:hypothetical protein Lepto7375DRAFT_8447 [Leptolyngbya sp. PCC 7375]